MVVGRVILHSVDNLDHDTVVSGRLEQLFRRRFQIVEDRVGQSLRALIRDVEVTINRVVQPLVDGHPPRYFSETKGSTLAESAFA